GDNKKPGHELHDTPRGGNIILKRVFEALHLGDRTSVPPFFVFTRASSGRDVVFRGLAVPGAAGLSQTQDLVAAWKTTRGRRFQNYRAIFTVVDAPHVARGWLDQIRSGADPDEGAPTAWQSWRRGGAYLPLSAPRTLEHRARDEQLPVDELRKGLLDRVVSFYKAHPLGEYAFERCAVELVRLRDGSGVSADEPRT